MGGASGGRCFCQFRLFVREVDPPLPEQPGGSCGSRGQDRPRPPVRPPARARRPRPPWPGTTTTSSSCSSSATAVRAAGAGGAQGPAGRGPRGPWGGRTGGPAGGRTGRRGPRGAGGGGARRPQAPGVQARGSAGLFLCGSGCRARGMHAPALAPASRVTLVKSRDRWSLGGDPGSSPGERQAFSLRDLGQVGFTSLSLSSCIREVGTCSAGR